ncbi:MAG TPA: alpha/beta hydrolase [Campylobacterales bacterium]|nr:alpha/beta hydrolase [Campylobacterales bacterium]HHS92801.1 alpha/beta hydrolase [Campylobacterales bacterium]
MKYFNGFSLKGEESFLSDYFIESDYCVAGFSYGAQKAFEYVYQSEERVDRLILISPAFFQNHKKSFIKTQLRYFKADEDAYTKAFLENVAYPSNLSLNPYLEEASYESLNELLTYRWEPEKIQTLLHRGVIIEVFMGAKDKIVDVDKSYEFFSPLVPLYFFKEKGHLLLS